MLYYVKKYLLWAKRYTVLSGIHYKLHRSLKIRNTGLSVLIYRFFYYGIPNVRLYTHTPDVTNDEVKIIIMIQSNIPEYWWKESSQLEAVLEIFNKQCWDFPINRLWCEFHAKRPLLIFVWFPKYLQKTPTPNKVIGTYPQVNQIAKISKYPEGKNTYFLNFTTRS